MAPNKSMVVETLELEVNPVAWQAKSSGLSSQQGRGPGDDEVP